MISLENDLISFFRDFSQTASIDGYNLLVIKDDSNVLSNGIQLESLRFITSQKDFILSGAKIGSTFILGSINYQIISFSHENDLKTFYIESV